MSLSSNTAFSDFDIQMMQKAIDLARKGVYSTKPNPAVGCVITQQEKIIAEGWHQKAGEPHAERVALANATESVKGATVYVTLEPCSHHGKTPPCADALVESGVARVVIAMQDPNPLVAGNGIKRLEQAGIVVDSGILSEEAAALNKGFVSAMKSNRPFIRLKVANSLDGRTAMANGESQWITGPESRNQVHLMRAQHGAIVTGVGTVLADDPSLNVRLPDDVLAELGLTAENCHPLRVVLDANLSTPLEAKMLSLPGRTLLMTSKETADQNLDLIERFYQKGAEVIAVESDGDKLDIPSVLSYLVESENIYDVMVEAGAIVAGAFIQADVVNELHVFTAPILMGEMAKPMFVLPGLVEMVDKKVFAYQSVQALGEDLYLVLTPKNVSAEEV